MIKFLNVLGSFSYVYEGRTAFENSIFIPILKTRNFSSFFGVLGFRGFIYCPLSLFSKYNEVKLNGCLYNTSERPLEREKRNLEHVFLFLDTRYT